MGDTHIAASCSAADVQAAIDLASDGDTVTVPAGEATYDDTHLVTCTKGITLQGAGIDSTIIYDATSGTYVKEPFVFTTKTGYTTIITGFTFDGASSGASSMGIVKVTGTYGTGNFRVHGNKFRNISIRGLVTNTIFGCIDNNTFLCPYNASAQAISIFGDGNTAWTRALTLGTANAVYIEDNTFTFAYVNDGCLDAYGGARYVFRYNTITNTTIGHHGCDSGSYRSTHSWEIYENTFDKSTAGTTRLFFSRGGTGVIYNNTYTGNYTVMELSNYRSCASYTTWGICDGDNPIDGNDDASGYHCQDQNGYTSTGTDDGTGPNQISSPVYCWGNTLDAVSVGLSVYLGCAAVADHIQENRDYFNGTAKPDYSAYTYPHPLQGETIEELTGAVYEVVEADDSVANSYTSPPSFGAPSRFTRANY